MPETGLSRISDRLTELEEGFLNDLERADRKAMTEAEVFKRQELRRKEQSELEERKAELELTVATQRDLKVQSETVPAKIRSFLEDFREMDVRQAKAILQGIMKTAHVYKDGRIELEFR